jgi:hypothetical protein
VFLDAALSLEEIVLTDFYNLFCEAVPHILNEL